MMMLVRTDMERFIVEGERGEREESGMPWGTERDLCVCKGKRQVKERDKVSGRPLYSLAHLAVACNERQMLLGQQLVMMLLLLLVVLMLMLLLLLLLLLLLMLLVLLVLMLVLLLMLMLLLLLLILLMCLLLLLMLMLLLLVLIY